MSISRKTIAWTLGIVAALYLGLAYALAPWAWRHYEHQRGLADRPMITTTRFGIPGDALNVGLEGDQADVICAMLAAGWHPADPVTLRSSARIVGDVLARRAYPTAPVSDLLYDGRRQDLAFQKPSGVSPSRRHHVRFWKVLDQGDDGLPVWLGAATYDSRVGFSHYTGQVTHHIGPTSTPSAICSRAISPPPATWRRLMPSAAWPDPPRPQRRRRSLFHRRRDHDFAPSARLREPSRRPAGAGESAGRENPRCRTEIGACVPTSRRYRGSWASP